MIPKRSQKTGTSSNVHALTAFLFLKLFFGGFFSLVFSGALEFTRQDLPHVNVRTAITNVYGDLFARVCSSFPWFQNPVFLSIAQKVGIFWQTWEDSISDLISSSAGRPVSLKLQDGNKFSPDQILFLDQLISRSADVNPGVILTRLLSSSKPDFPEYVQVSACTSFASEVFVSMVWYELLHLWYMAFCNVLCEKIKDAFARNHSFPFHILEIIRVLRFWFFMLWYFRRMLRWTNSFSSRNKQIIL